MLAPLLTRQRLKSEAPLWFDRGLDYWKDKRVVARTSRDDEILGIVRGTREYDVRVFATPRGRLAAECTCSDLEPDRKRQILCKHAIALVLDHIDGGRAVPSVFSDAAAWATRPAGRAFATRDELEAWARVHHVEHELSVSAECLHDDLVKRSFGAHVDVLPAVTLREVASVDSARRIVGGSGGARAAAEAAARWLDRAAADVRAGLERETQPRIKPEDGPLPGLWEHLHDVRTDLRLRGAFPRLPTTCARGRLELDSETSAIVWSEPVTVRGPRSTMVPVEARLVLGPPQTMSCACGGDACTHGLALVDAALDLLADPTRSDRAHELATMVYTHPSQRALDALAAYEKAPRAAVIHISWEIRVDPEGRRPPALAALVKKPLTKVGFRGVEKAAPGWGPPIRMAPAALLGEYAAVLDEQDARIADHLAAWQPSLTTRLPKRAFLGLVGHPRAVLDDGHDRVEVVHCALAFGVRSAGDVIEVVPVAGDVVLDTSLLTNAIAGGVRGEPVVALDGALLRCLLIDVADEAHHVWRVLTRCGRAFRATDLVAVRERLAVLGVESANFSFSDGSDGDGE